MDIRLGLYGLFVLVLLVVSYADLRWRRIPNLIILPAIAIALVITLVGDDRVGALAGGLTGAAVFVIPVLLFGPNQAGVGDVKLALFIGLVLGFPAVLGALEIAALAALVVIIPGVLFRHWNRKTILPFGPFLALGALLVLLW